MENFSAQTLESFNTQTRCFTLYNIPRNRTVSSLALNIPVHADFPGKFVWSWFSTVNRGILFAANRRIVSCMQLAKHVIRLCHLIRPFKILVSVINLFRSCKNSDEAPCIYITNSGTTIVFAKYEFQKPMLNNEWMIWFYKTLIQVFTLLSIFKLISQTFAQQMEKVKKVKLSLSHTNDRIVHVYSVSALIRPNHRTKLFQSHWTKVVTLYHIGFRSQRTKLPC